MGIGECVVNEVFVVNEEKKENVESKENNNYWKILEILVVENLLLFESIPPPDSSFCCHLIWQVVSESSPVAGFRNDYF